MRRAVCDERTEDPMTRPNGPYSDFLHRALIVLALAVSGLLVLVALFYLAEVLLLVFAAVLFAVFLRGLADAISARTPLGPGWALTLVVLVLLTLLTALLVVLGPDFAAGMRDLAASLPRAIEQLERYLATQDWAQWIIENLPDEPGLPPGIVDRVTGTFFTVLGLAISALIVFFIGLYLAAEPGTYIEGMVRLVPPPRRARADEVLYELGHTLRWWLIGRLTTMALVGLLTATGLWLLDVPLALTLGILAGLLTFIPNIGPIVAAIPAVLMGFAEDAMTAVYVVVLYVVIQNVEGYLITPMIQRRVVAMPPALLIAAQIAMAVTLGALGLLLATPLMVVAMVLVRMLYIEDVLGDKPGRD